MDILEFALEFEAKSHAFYKEMAEKMVLKELKVLFGALANDEMNHISVLKELKESSGVTFESNHLGTSEEAFSKIIGAELDPNDFSKLRALKSALEFEDKSMKYYRDQSQNAQHVSERLIFLRLYFEEKKHREMVSDLIEFNTFIETSLETAEFQK